MWLGVSMTKLREHQKLRWMLDVGLFGDRVVFVYFWWMMGFGWILFCFVSQWTSMYQLDCR